MWKKLLCCCLLLSVGLSLSFSDDLQELESILNEIAELDPALADRTAAWIQANLESTLTTQLTEARAWSAMQKSLSESWSSWQSSERSLKTALS